MAPVSLYSVGLACIFWSLSLSGLFSRVDSPFVQSAVIPAIEYVLGPPLPHGYNNFKVCIVLRNW